MARQNLAQRGRYGYRLAMFSQTKTDAKSWAALCAYTLSLTSAVAFSSSPTICFAKKSTWKMLDVTCRPSLYITIWIIIEQCGIGGGVGQPNPSGNVPTANIATSAREGIQRAQTDTFLLILRIVTIKVLHIYVI